MSTHAAQGTQSGRQGGPRNPEWKTSVGDRCGRQVGDKCKLMRPKAPRVGDKGETSVSSCGPRNPESQTSVGDKCGRQVGDKGETCGRQV